MLGKIFTRNVAIVFAIGAVGCSSNFSPNAKPGSLPKDWYQLPENAVGHEAAQPVLSSPAARPDEKAKNAVESVFKADVNALDGFDSTPLRGPLAPALSAPGQASDWVPWHLEGFIASFAVSVDGIFGALLFEGTPSAKATWVRVAEGSQPELHTSVNQKSAALVITATTKNGDVAKQLEPAIRTALATGIIQGDAGERALRNGLVRLGEDFRATAQALAATPIASGWRAEQYRLDLTFNASGQVTPVVGVGASVGFRFDWTKPEGQAPAASALPGSQGLSQFVRMMSEEIQNSLQSSWEESTEIRQSGFKLDEVRIGLGISAGGDIGVAQAQGSATGSITFAKSEGMSMASAKSADAGMVNLIGKTQNTSALIYARANHLQIKEDSGFGDVVYQISRKQFRKGMVRAIEMGTYFAERAKGAQNEKWRLSEIETEFDVSVGGTVGVTNVNGLGVFVLTFSKSEKAGI